MIPRFIRRWNYKRLLKAMESPDRHPDEGMCVNIIRLFPWMAIQNYPELWNRRMGPLMKRPKNHWFDNNEDRLRYIREAIQITERTIVETEFISIGTDYYESENI